MEAQKIAIGKVVWGASDTLMSIIPREDGMIIATMYYADEVKELPKTYNKPEVTEAELKMANTLINTMDTPFDPAAYHNEYQEKVSGLVETKIAGGEVVGPKEEEKPKDNIISIMDRLSISVEEELKKKGKTKAPTKRTTKKSKGA